VKRIQDKTKRPVRGKEREPVSAGSGPARSGEKIEVNPMSDMAILPAAMPGGEAQIPEELAVEIRRLAHDLSNALEVIVQTSYLLSLAEMKKPATDWLPMLDSGVNKAVQLNLELREYIKRHMPD
jgi:hypothetical protein